MRLFRSAYKQLSVGCPNNSDQGPGCKKRLPSAASFCELYASALQVHTFLLYSLREGVILFWQQLLL